MFVLVIRWTVNGRNDALRFFILAASVIEFDTPDVEENRVGSEGKTRKSKSGACMQQMASRGHTRWPQTKAQRGA